MVSYVKLLVFVVCGFITSELTFAQLVQEAQCNWAIQDGPLCAQETDSCTDSLKIKICQRYCGVCVIDSNGSGASTNVAASTTENPLCKARVDFLGIEQCRRSGFFSSCPASCANYTDDVTTTAEMMTTTQLTTTQAKTTTAIATSTDTPTTTSTATLTITTPSTPPTTTSPATGTLTAIVTATTKPTNTSTATPTTTSIATLTTTALTPTTTTPPSTATLTATTTPTTTSTVTPTTSPKTTPITTQPVDLDPAVIVTIVNDTTLSVRIRIVGEVTAADAERIADQVRDVLSRMGIPITTHQVYKTIRLSTGSDRKELVTEIDIHYDVTSNSGDHKKTIDRGSKGEKISEAVKPNVELYPGYAEPFSDAPYGFIPNQETDDWDGRNWYIIAGVIGGLFLLLVIILLASIGRRRSQQQKLKITKEQEEVKLSDGVKLSDDVRNGVSNGNHYTV